MPVVTGDDDGLDNTLVFERIVFGQPGEVAGVRASMRRWLDGCPVADDVVLIASELASNAVLHSASAELYFTVRAEIHPLAIRVECEDLGGPWQPRMVEGEPQHHGLDIVAALSEDWGTETRSCDNRRIVWAQVASPRYVSSNSALGHLMATWPAENICTQLAFQHTDAACVPMSAARGPGAQTGGEPNA